MRAALVAVVTLAMGCTSTTAPPARSVASPAVPPPVPPARTPLAALEVSRDLDNAIVGEERSPTVVILLASWCHRCRDEIAVFDGLRGQHPHVRWLGLNYKPHEEYDQRGNAAAVRALADETPWLRIVPADDALFAAFGSPPKVPTIFVYNSKGVLVATFDRREREAPREQELDDLLRSLE